MRFARWLLVRGAGVAAALGLSLLVLAASHIVRHASSCHPKSPGHCTARVSSPAVSSAEGTDCLAACRLPEAERVELDGVVAPRPILATDAAGRSPPV